MENEFGRVPTPSFKGQFGVRVEFKTIFGNARTVDIKPAVETEEPTPLFVIPGWSITLNTQKPLLQSFYNLGKHTFSVEFPRFGGIVPKIENEAREVVRQAEIVSELIKSRPEEKIDVVAQSMGAMDLIAATKLHPELLSQIRKVVFISPAGLSGNDNFFKLLGRFIPHLGQDVVTAIKSSEKRNDILRMMKESNIYIAKNPLRAIVGEASAIANSSEYQGLKDLQNAGVKIGIIQGESDKLTPPKNLWEKIGEGHESAFAESEQTKSGFVLKDQDPQDPPFDAITMVGGGHDNRIYAEPDFAKKILRQLNFLS